MTIGRCSRSMRPRARHLRRWLLPCRPLDRRPGMTIVRGMKAISLVLVLAAALAALPATGSARPAQKGCRAGVLHPVGTGTSAYAAVVRGKTETFKRPAGPALASFPKLNENGYPTTFSIIGA